MRSITNKRGFSLGSWIETALFASLFIILIVALFANMNVNYDKELGDFGELNNLANTTQSSLSGYQDTLQQSVKSGESASTGLGISLSTTWNIITGGANIIWLFLTGGWISILTLMVGLPPIVGNILQILYVISIGLIILRLVLKINA